MATGTRAGAKRSSVAMAAELTIGWRSDGTGTAGPRPIRDVAIAASARVIQTSGYSAGEP
jgi:hypothetical protein